MYRPSIHGLRRGPSAGEKGHCAQLRKEAGPLHALISLLFAARFQVGLAACPTTSACGQMQHSHTASSLTQAECRPSSAVEDASTEFENSTLVLDRMKFMKSAYFHPIRTWQT